MSNTGSRALIAILIAASLSSIGFAAVLHVPGDYAGIQIAINICSNGDVILVSPGVYSENISFKGKAITLSSTNPADPNVVSATIIHGSGQTSVVTFSHGETTNSVLAGFTVTGGYGSVNAMFGTNYCWGAGVYCYAASPTILGNIIVANAGPQGDATIYGYGGGIACIQSDAVIARNLIMANTGSAGGGIATYAGNARIADNIICSNTVSFGGGVLLMSGGRLINNTLVGNSAQFAGNAYATSDASGQCVVTGNIICNATNGGGLYVDSQDTLTLTTCNDVWNNTGGDYCGLVTRTGLNGNISQDPQFVDAGDYDYHLRDGSPCINAGEPTFQPTTGERDFYGNPRVYAGRVDIGASEYSDNFRPIAEAGPDQAVTVIFLPALIMLNGSASTDPSGAALSYHWRQASGPAGHFINPRVAKPAFRAPALGTYSFELAVSNGKFVSFPDTVRVTLKNEPPTADASADQIYSDAQEIASITLDGSKSSDPEHAALRYRWTQTSGWQVQLSNPTAVNPTLMHPWPGTYRFQLVVNDGLHDSQPSAVAVYIGPDLAPVADAGPSRYAAADSIMLDGTGSYGPNGCGTLTYQWQQVSGPAATLTGADTPTPVISGFKPTNALQACVFQLVVNDGHLASQPTNVTVTVVRSFGTNALSLENPPFDPARPTILAFGGGNCTTGSGLGFGGIWDQQVNWITVSSYGPVYTKYGDMLMVYLSSLAPDYRQRIQAIGWSTGNLPAMEVAWYVNATYKDARYAVNRVSLLDAVCSYLGTRVAQYDTNRVAGEQCWVDNYISNDPGYSPANYIAEAVNVACSPYRSHYYPVGRYSSSSLDYTNGGLTAFAYLSVIGSGKNYQLNTAAKKYYYKIDATESMVFFNQTLWPGRILAPVQLTGPLDGATLDAQGTALGCQPVENAVGYQLLIGSAPDRVMDYTIISDTTNPPQHTITALPQPYTWWTVKAYDQFGSTIYADPRLIQLPANRPPVADAGSDRVVYTGLDGKATVTLSGSKSSDLDGDALLYTWAWAVGDRAYLTNGVSLTVELPVGVHPIQLMVNDGHANSRLAQVNITVVGPLECKVKIAPSTINLLGNNRHIIARVRLLHGITWEEAESGVPLLIYPGGIQSVKRWTVGRHANHVSLFAFFDKSDLAAEPLKGRTELTVVGQLRSGQVFFGRDTVQIIAKRKTK